MTPYVCVCSVGECQRVCLCVWRHIWQNSYTIRHLLNTISKRQWQGRVTQMLKSTSMVLYCTYTDTFQASNLPTEGFLSKHLKLQTHLKPSLVEAIAWSDGAPFFLYNFSTVSSWVSAVFLIQERLQERLIVETKVSIQRKCHSLV